LVLIGHFSFDFPKKKSVQGNGEMSEQYPQVPPFTSLRVGSGIQVKLSKGENRVNLKAESNLLEPIETIVEDNVLIIR
jgi:hypothetical protein